MKVKEGTVRFDKPTKEVNIWISRTTREKAKILEAKQDSLGRVYITVY